MPLPLCVCIFDPPPLHTCGEGEGVRFFKMSNLLSLPYQWQASPPCFYQLIETPNFIFRGAKYLEGSDHNGTLLPLSGK
jgi:hypothetical protein